MSVEFEAPGFAIGGVGCLLAGLVHAGRWIRRPATVPAARRNAGSKTAPATGPCCGARFAIGLAKLCFGLGGCIGMAVALGGHRTFTTSDYNVALFVLLIGAGLLETGSHARCWGCRSPPAAAFALCATLSWGGAGLLVKSSAEMYGGSSKVVELHSTSRSAEALLLYTLTIVTIVDFAEMWERVVAPPREGPAASWRYPFALSTSLLLAGSWCIQLAKPFWVNEAGALSPEYLHGALYLRFTYHVVGVLLAQWVCLAIATCLGCGPGDVDLEGLKRGRYKTVPLEV